MSSYEPLHHKYRPQTFADLVGQDAIAMTLTNAITSQRIAPAYLFTGPRGTGKTSSARILAKSLNCLSSDRPTPSPCGTCEVCRAIAQGSALDTIEIDAASNTGVDNIREIIERAQFAPVQCRYKVYVIDECHMLSVSAFNALLKTLEEPPDRVIFILATTDPQRVLPTIISRCQRFDYRRIPLEAMVSHLSHIATQESIDIDPEALTLVAQIANGGLRDAESLLDQLSLLSGTITPEKVWDLVGAVPERDLLTLLQAIYCDRAEAVLEQCRYLMNRGREPLVVLQNLASFYLNLLIAKTSPSRPDLVAVTAPTWQALCQEAQRWELPIILQGQQHLKSSETQLKNTTQPRLWLEVTLLGLLPSACRPHASPSNKLTGLTDAQTQRWGDAEMRIPALAATPEPPTPEAVPQQITSPQEPIPLSNPAGEKIDRAQLWSAVLDRLPPFTQALVRPHCHLISLQGTVAQIGIKTEPLLRHAQGKIQDLEGAFAEICQQKVRVKLQVVSSSEPDSYPSVKEGIGNRESGVGERTPLIAGGENSLIETDLKKDVGEEIETDASTIEPQIPPQSLKSSNGHQPAVSSQPIGEGFSQPIEQPPELPARGTLPQTESAIAPSSSSGNLLTPDSAEEIEKAAESLAKVFDGEIVKLSSKSSGQTLSQEKSTQTAIANSQANTDPDGLSQEKPTPSRLPLAPREARSQESTKPLILGRPDPRQLADDDEIPF
jgi:DNA polymerase-3 subunit gamma/tau